MQSTKKDVIHFQFSSPSNLKFDSKSALNITGKFV